jgi:HAMP domain-containing protein
LEPALLSQPIRWDVGAVLGGEKTEPQYVVVAQKLYLVFGVALRQTSDEAPKYAYFCGFAITNDWLNQLLLSGPDPKGNGADAPPRNSTEAAVVTWFDVDGQRVASGTSRTTGLGARDEQLMSFVSEQISKDMQGLNISIEKDIDGDTLIGQYSTFEPAPGVRGVLVAVSSLNEQLQPLRDLQRYIAAVTSVVVLLALVAAWWMSRRLANPVEQLVEGTKRIAQGDFTHTINIKRNDELGELARSFNEMAIGLAQRDLIKDTLGQFVDPRIADALLTNPASLRGQRLVQSVLFSDLEKFTSISESATALSRSGDRRSK